ncbi:protein HEADING DATE REPRESSOR 1 isoform X2 [Vigna unguiculata]|uniref:protein HEADING DATE REPRESSOR 1 isoform X2 n=1 Tax=Vigna unguiculata TaxID=3917 RepID=UPI00101688FD|nr:protein HEADING DATE REPRESSOR 1 isoform X2 [Vigna unguiculata]
MENMKMAIDDALNAFSPVSTPTIYWKSRRRLASGRNLEVSEDTANTPSSKQEDTPTPIPTPTPPSSSSEEMQNTTPISERRKALFEPLEPIKNVNGRRPSAESLLPPPDFESANYPKGWLIGKKRKLVNVDVVESMRRIAIQEMNRKDREIDGLNEQLEEDSRCLEHLQLQLVDERSKRARVERENAMLQEQVNMLMTMLQEAEQMGEEGPDEP